MVLIDDDLEDLEIVEESIRIVNPLVQCRTFLDPRDAINTLRVDKSSPEVIIIDFSMPKMSGLDCLAHLRALEKSNKVLFAMYSSVVLPQNILNSIINQGVFVFKKPSTFDELVKIMRCLMVRL